MGVEVVFTRTLRNRAMKRNLTPAEVRAYRELAVAARRLRKVQQKAEQRQDARRGGKGVANAK
jgi:hypothetical protein